jgi:hypothetical protein
MDLDLLTYRSSDECQNLVLLGIYDIHLENILCAMLLGPTAAKEDRKSISWTRCDWWSDSSIGTLNACASPRLTVMRYI